MKKVISIGIVVILLFFLCACESVQPVQTNAGQPHVAVTQPSETAIKPSAEATIPSIEETTPSIEETIPSVETTTPDTEPSTSTNPTQNTLPADDMVWIPTKGGTKYHKTATCSGMDGPKQVTKTEASNQGFDPCKKCYK